MVEGGSEYIDTFGDFAAVVAEELGAQELTAVLIAGQAQADGAGAGIIGFVVVNIGFKGEGVKTSGSGFFVAEAGTRSDYFKDFDDLRAESSGVLVLAANEVLAGDRALFVGGGAKGEINVAV